MAKQIDERVVQMKFENGQFERGVQTSIKTVQELKKGLDFEDSIKGFEKLDKASQSIKLDALISAVDTINDKFTLLGMTGVKILSRIADKAIDTGEKLIKSLSTEQIEAGWNKFAQKTTSVQTIMSATASKFSDTGEQMAVVTEQLDKLNWFTDETSYNFLDMVNNIGKFTSNNIDLDKSVTAMQGIANWAAISGANVQEASRAMYNISQAMSAGSMKLIDWKSIENANMATAEFKKTALETAVAIGTLKKSGDDMFVTLDGKAEISAENFSGFTDSLKKEWLNTEVLMTTLDRYGAATNKLNEIYEKHGILTSDIVSGIDEYIQGTKTAEEISKDWGISLEETSQYLEEFSSETMQFGLKAFKAAQEAKTFQDAIDSVKDAVSTGWMKSFELLFGNYLEAKDFWTEIANTLYGIFAESGNARNELLKDWYSMGGRNDFIDTIYAGFSALLSIMTPLRLGWQSIFTPMDADRLFNITKRIHDFVVGLTLSDEAQLKLTRTVRGLVSVLDILKTVAFGGVGKVFKIISALSGQSSLDILEFTARIGDFLYSIRNWVKEQTFLNDALDVGVDYIIRFVSNIKNFVWWFKDLPSVQAAASRGMELFNAVLLDGEALFRSLRARVALFWESLKSDNVEIRSIQDVIDILIRFKKSVFDHLFDDMGERFSELSKVLPAIADDVKKVILDIAGKFPILETVVGRINQVFGTFFNILKTSGTDAFKFATKALKDFISQFNVLDAVFVITAVGMFKALNTILHSVESIISLVKDSVTAITDVVGVFGKAWSKYMKSKSMVNYATAVLILVGALALLTMLDYDKLVTASIVLGSIGVGMVAFAAAMALINNKLGGVGSSPLIQVGFAILSMAAGIFLLAKALEAIQKSSAGGKSIATLATLIVALGAFAIAMKKFSGDLKDGAGVILAFAAGILLLTSAIKTLGKMDTQTLGKGFVALTAVLLVFGAAVRLMTKTNTTFVRGEGNNIFNSTTGAAAQILAFAASVHLIILAFKAIDKLQPETILKGLVTVGAIFLEFAALQIIMSRLGKSGFSGSIGTTMLAMSAAIWILIPAMKSLASMEDEELKKAAINMTVIGGVFVAAIAVSKLAGSEAHKAGAMLIEMALAMAVMPIVIRAFGNMEPEVLKKGLTAFTILGAVFSLAIAASAKANEAKGAIIAITVAIGIMGALIYVLSQLDTTSVIASAGSLSALLLSLAVSFKLLNSSKMGFKDMGTMLSGLYAMVGVVALLAEIIRVMNDIPNPATAVVMSVSLSALILAMSGAMKIMNKMEPLDSKVLGQFYIMAGAIAALAAIIVAMSSIPGLENRKALELSQIMSLLMLELVGVFAIFSKVMSKTKLDWDVIGQFGMFSVLAGLVGGIVMVLSNNMKNSKAAIDAAAALGILMPTLALAMGIVAKMDVKFDLGQAGQFAVFEVLLGALGAIIIGLAKLNDVANTDVTRIYPLLAAIVVILPVLSTVTSGMALVGNVVQGSLGPVAELSAAMAVVFTVVAGLITGFAWIANEFDAIGNALEVAPHYCEQLGLAIGNLVGGIAGGIITNVGSAIIDLFPKLGTALGDFVRNLGAGFFDTLKSIDDSVVSGAANFALVMLAIGTGEVAGAVGTLVGGVIDKISKFLGIDTDLKKKFKTIGSAIAAFAKELRGVDGEQVKNAAEAATILASLEKSLPAKGGKLQEWLGEKDIGKFGERLKTFGEGLKNFAEQTGDIDAEKVQNAANAAKLLIELEKGVPAQDGDLQKFLGKKDLGDFGVRLVSFGLSLKVFATTVEGITKASVSGAAAAAEMLIDLEDNIVPSDGALQDFLGHQSFGDFGTRLITLGTSLVSYINTTKGITGEDVAGSAAAISALANIEKELKVTGGAGALFFGDASFSQFAKNLEDLGKALDAYDMYIDNVDLVQFNKMTSALRSMVTLTDELQNVGNWSAELKTALSNWIAAIGQDFASQADTIKGWGSDIVKQIVQGITDALSKNTPTVNAGMGKLANGMNDRFKSVLKINGSYSEVMKENGTFIIAGLMSALNDQKQIAEVKNASADLAKAVNESFRNEAEIHSPSAVMQENGVWLVEGLAEGIKKNMSAEEAMAKKAKNISEAFKTAVEEAGILKERDQLQYKLWEANEGLAATEEEKANKKIEYMVSELEYMVSNVEAQRAALATVAKEFGESSKYYMEAENTLNKAILEMYEKRNEIGKAQAELKAKEKSSVEKAREYSKLMSQDWVKEFQQMWGYDDEALSQWAQEEVGMVKKTTEEEKQYHQLMRQDWFKESQKWLDYTDEQMQEWARTETGYIPKEKIETEAKDINLADIIAPAFAEQQVEVAKSTIANGVSKAVSSGVKQGLDEGIEKADPEGTGKTVPEGFEEGVTDPYTWEGLKKKAAQEAGGVEDYIRETLGINSPAKVMIPLGEAIPEGLGVGITNGGSYLTNAAKVVTTQLTTAMQTSMPKFQTLGQQAMEGFVKGIQSAGQAAISTAQSIASKVASTMAKALSIHSPSRVTMRIGEYVSLGLAKGIMDNAGAVTNASEDLANNTITMLDYARSAIDDVLSSDDDFEPMITPVLNMDDLKKQARNIPSILSSQNGISTRLADIAAQNVNRQRREAVETKFDQKPEENITNINYTQNNYSPKPLNRRDIYRQTNNQISQLKGALRR